MVAARGFCFAQNGSIALIEVLFAVARHQTHSTVSTFSVVCCWTRCWVPFDEEPRHGPGFIVCHRQSIDFNISFSSYISCVLWFIYDAHVIIYLSSPVAADRFSQARHHRTHSSCASNNSNNSKCTEHSGHARIFLPSLLLFTAWWLCRSLEIGKTVNEPKNYSALQES